MRVVTAVLLVVAEAAAARSAESIPEGSMLPQAGIPSLDVLTGLPYSLVCLRHSGRDFCR